MATQNCSWWIQNISDAKFSLVRSSFREDLRSLFLNTFKGNTIYYLQAVWQIQYYKVGHFVGLLMNS
jgi:hypothetical protein